MASEKRLTEKHYNGDGYYMKCSGTCSGAFLCDDCPEMGKLVDRLGELEDAAGKAVVVEDRKLRGAMKMLQEKYERAKNDQHVRDPLAYALFYTWNEIDNRAFAKERRCEDGK